MNTWLEQVLYNQPFIRKLAIKVNSNKEKEPVIITVSM